MGVEVDGTIGVAIVSSRRATFSSPFKWFAKESGKMWQNPGDNLDLWVLTRPDDGDLVAEEGVDDEEEIWTKALAVACKLLASTQSIRTESPAATPNRSASSAVTIIMGVYCRVLMGDVDDGMA